MDHLKDAVPGCSVFGSQGPKISLTRWLGWFERYRYFEFSWHSLLLALCVIGLYTGRWSSCMEMPIWGSVYTNGLALEDGQAQGEQGQQGSKEKDATEKYAAAMELAARILGTPGKRDSARRIWRICKPIVSAFGKQLSGMKGPRQSLAYYMSFSLGKYDWVLRKTWGVLSDPEALSYMGFDVFKRVGAASASAAALSATESEKAHHAFRLAFCLVKGRSMCMGRYKHTCPAIFVQLISKQQQVVDAGLLLAEQVWDIIREADVQAKVYADIKSALACMVWAGDTFVREVLVLLAQHRFRFVCEPVKEMIHGAFDGFLQTAICENANGACRDRQRDNKNLKMSRLSQYMFPVTRGVLKDFDFPEVAVSDAERVAPGAHRSVLDMCFASGGGEPSIDTRNLLRITGPRTWPSPTPQSEELSVGALFLLRSVVKSKKWGDAAQAWREAVIPEMSLLRRAEDRSCYMVLCSSVWGCLLWPAAVDDEGQHFSIGVDDNSSAMWTPICSWDGWACLSWQPSPPSQASGRLLLRLTGEERSPLVAAAHAGFHHFTEPIFDAVVKDIGADRSQIPKARIDKLFWLMRQVLPELSDPELARIMASSWFAGKVEEAELARQSHLAIADSVLDEKDRRDFQDFTNNKVRQQELDALAFVAFLSETGLKDKYPDLVKALGSTVSAMAKVIEEKQAATAVAKAHGGVVAMSACPGEQAESKKGVVRQRIPPDLDLVRWRALLPTCTGCVGQIYDKSRSAQVYYPGVVPASRSRTWSSTPGHGFNKQQVLVHCAMWAWHHHRAETGEQCPHDFGDMADLSVTRS